MRLVPDRIWVAMTIRQESDGEPYIGKLAVAEVIRNRMETRYNSDGTGYGTVLYPFQFSGWNTNDPNRIRVANIDDKDYLTQQALQAYDEAFNRRTDITFGANLYHSRHMSPYPAWTLSQKVIKTAEIGNHIFYKERR